MPCWTRNANQKNLSLNFLLLQIFKSPPKEISKNGVYCQNSQPTKVLKNMKLKDFSLIFLCWHSKITAKSITEYWSERWVLFDYKTHFTVFGNKRNTSAKYLKPHTCTYHRLCKLEGRIYWRLHNLSSSKGIQKTSIRTVRVIWWLMSNV